MTVFLILLAALLVSILVPMDGDRRPARDAARMAMAFAMVFAGVGHLVAPDPFVRMVPEFVPQREVLIFATGVLEILLGVGLAASARHRSDIALVLVTYLVAVFPANVHAAVADISAEELGGVNPWLRLPFQAIYIVWVFWAVPGLPAHMRSILGRPDRQPALHPRRNPRRRATGAS